MKVCHIEKVTLYNEGAAEKLNLKETAKYLRGKLGKVPVEIKGAFPLFGPEESLDYAKKLGDRGVYLEYDNWGAEGYYPFVDISHPSDAMRVDAMVKLVDEGYLEQILLSHDVCSKLHLTAFGGFGYAHILRNIVPRLKKAGISHKEIETMLIDNPRRVLQKR